MTKSENYSWPFYIDNIPNIAQHSDTFTKADCDLIVEKLLDKSTDKSTLEGDVYGESIRNSKSVFISPNDVPGLFQRITQVCVEMNEANYKFDIFGLYEGLQFTQYDEGSYYKKHIDRLSYGLVRKLTIVIQLDDDADYEGGDLILTLGDGNHTIRASRDKGTLIMFPSWIIHEVTPVTRGTRRSLVGWITGKPFV